MKTIQKNYDYWNNYFKTSPHIKYFDGLEKIYK